MTIKIVLPEGGDTRPTNGIRVFTDSGHEIEGMSRIQCDWSVDEILEATITVAVSEIENLEGIEGIIIPEINPKTRDAVIALNGVWPEEGEMIDHYTVQHAQLVDRRESVSACFVCRKFDFEVAAKIMGHSQ